jgi:hypothetical protein
MSRPSPPCALDRAPSGPNVAIAEIAEFMAKHDLPNVPVTTSAGELIGLLHREEAVLAVVLAVG